ncbi:MAG: acyl-CoA dehydrogenase family protein, partial [Desulfobacterales bacterium]
EAYPGELLPGLAELGMLGAVIPEEFGGAGLDDAAYRVVIEELGAADSSIRSLVSVNLGLVGNCSDAMCLLMLRAKALKVTAVRTLSNPLHQTFLSPVTRPPPIRWPRSLNGSCSAL